MSLKGADKGAHYNHTFKASDVIHETTHILAFSKSLFPFYRTSGLIPRTPRDPLTGLPPTLNGSFVAANTTIIVVQERNGTVTKLVLPRMLLKARSHFACMTLNGVELGKIQFPIGENLLSSKTDVNTMQ